MNSSPLSSLFDMDARRQQWNAEKPVYSGGMELRFSRTGGELVFFHFVSTGQDGDQFIHLYKGHQVKATTSKGEAITVVKYCPVLSGVDDATCQYCDGALPFEGVKERMSMWLYITDILHTSLPQEKQFPTVPYGGRVYFREEVNGFKIWHSSAWRESPWDDIVRFATLYKGLHNFMAQMVVSGSGMARRYKMYAMPQDPGQPPLVLSDETYERAKTECKPIVELLKENLGSPTQEAPQGLPAGQQPFNPGRAPLGTMGTMMEAFAPGVPGAGGSSNPPSSSPQALPEIHPEEDNKRPLSSMF